MKWQVVSGKWQVRAAFRIFTAFLLFLSLITYHLPLAYADPVDTVAKQAILIDLSNHSVLFEKDADVAMHPSSMSKLMTIYLLFERLKAGQLKLRDTFPVSEKAWRTEGSKSFVGIGDHIPIEDLIQGIVVQSGNDACIVIAEGISGSEETFVEEMNRTATKMGLTKSHFANATGLPDPNHLMSARDLATLAEHIITEFPEYYHYFSIKQYTYNNITQQNRNRLLGNDLNIDGLKTGHTDEGGYGIVLSAEKSGRRLILVINGLASDEERIDEGDKLMRYGFSAFTSLTIAHKDQKIADAEVWLGEKATVPLVGENDVMITIPNGMSNDVSISVRYNGPIAAPIAKGTHVADLVMKLPGHEPEIIPLVAGVDVGKAGFFGRVIAGIKRPFTQ